MWNEFITAFSPFFEYFYLAVDKIFSIFLNTTVIDGVPQGISLFGVPILLFPIMFMFIVLIFKTIFGAK